MKFKEVQEGVINNAMRYGKDFDIKIDEDFALLKLYKEVGELAQAILIHRKKSRPEKHVDAAISKQHIAEELADVVGMALVNASLFDIDLEKALQEKWIKTHNYGQTKSKTTSA